MSSHIHDIFQHLMRETLSNAWKDWWAGKPARSIAWVFAEVRQLHMRWSLSRSRCDFVFSFREGIVYDARKRRFINVHTGFDAASFMVEVSKKFTNKIPHAMPFSRISLWLYFVLPGKNIVFDKKERFCHTGMSPQARKEEGKTSYHQIGCQELPCSGLYSIVVLIVFNMSHESHISETWSTRKATENSPP